jgi:hypothetical protein
MKFSTGCFNDGQRTCPTYEKQPWLSFDSVRRHVAMPSDSAVNERLSLCSRCFSSEHVRPVARATVRHVAHVPHWFAHSLWFVCDVVSCSLFTVVVVVVRCEDLDKTYNDKLCLEYELNASSVHLTTTDECILAALRKLAGLEQQVSPTSVSNVHCRSCFFHCRFLS